jgi:hypothetical protein
MMTRLRVILLLSLATLCTPAFGANPAGPGTINYVEGGAKLAGGLLTPESVGNATLETGQELTTGEGRAEMLLAPGVFLRLDDDSAVRMVSPSLTHTAVDLERGRAMVEVDDIHRQNDIQIVDRGIPTQLLKPGLYEWNANDGETMVFSGREAVNTGENHWTVVKAHHELALTPGEIGKPKRFDVKANEDDLYNWSSLRSGYLAEANSQIAGVYPYAAGFAPGWFWDPYMYGYTFFGPDPFFSPFGWGFYPPWSYGGSYGGRGYGRGFYGRPGVGGHPLPHGEVRGGEGFHGEGFHGGGFSGGGGFHGDGFGGGGRR